MWMAVGDDYDYVLAGVESCDHCRLRSFFVFFCECLFSFLWNYSEGWFGRLRSPLAKIVSLFAQLFRARSTSKLISEGVWQSRSYYELPIKSLHPLTICTPIRKPLTPFAAGGKLAAAVFQRRARVIVCCHAKSVTGRPTLVGMPPSTPSCLGSVPTPTES